MHPAGPQQAGVVHGVIALRPAVAANAGIGIPRMRAAAGGSYGGIVNHEGAAMTTTSDIRITAAVLAVAAVAMAILATWLDAGMAALHHAGH